MLPCERTERSELGRCLGPSLSPDDDLTCLDSYGKKTAQLWSCQSILIRQWGLSQESSQRLEGDVGS